MGRRLDTWFRGYRSALGHRDVRLLLTSLLISATGSWAYNVALLAFVFERTNSLAWVGAAGIVRFVPALLLSAYAGVVAERMERVRLMLWSDWLCVAWQAGLVVIAATDGPVALGLAFAALTSATNVVYEPAVAATIPSLVEEDDLVAANALNGTIQSLVVVAGPRRWALLCSCSVTLRARSQSTPGRSPCRLCSSRASTCAAVRWTSRRRGPPGFSSR